MFEPIAFDNNDNNDNNLAFNFVGYEAISPAIIKVVGVGGGGGNAVEHMSRLAEQESIKGVEFYDVNTDAQVLSKRTTRQTIQIGANITKGLGAGANPEVGRKAAEEDRDAIANMLSGADMVFIAVGMGGGTGTGAAPLVAEIAKEQGALTVAVVTKPFRFEGPKRMRLATQGIQEISKHVDSLIIIPNDNLQKMGSGITAIQALSAANQVLSNCVLGITNMITSAGGPTGNDINVDFADVRTVMSDKGHAMIGTGFAEGDDRAEKAMKAALASPLLENVDISGAQGMLISINAGTDLELDEIYKMTDLVNGYAIDDATVVFGCSYYPEMNGKVGVTIVATGIGSKLNEMRNVGTPNIPKEPDWKPQQPKEPPKFGWGEQADNQPPVWEQYANQQQNAQQRHSGYNTQQQTYQQPTQAQPNNLGGVPNFPNGQFVYPDYIDKK